MQVSVKLFAFFTRSVSAEILAQHPGGIRSGMPVALEVPEGSTLEDLVNLLELPKEQIKVMFVNGRARGTDFVLAPGDEVGIFPPIAGG
jgi:molybdopterin synthase sulfur carrier subunit